MAWLKKCYADECKVNQKLKRDVLEKEPSSGMKEYLQTNRERARVYEREVLFLWRAVCVNAAGSFRRLPLAAFDTIPPGGRLFVSPIITQIGRENKFSADIYMCIRRGDLRSPAGEHSSPLPCYDNILMRRSIIRVDFLFAVIVRFLQDIFDSVLRILHACPRLPPVY